MIVNTPKNKPKSQSAIDFVSGWAEMLKHRRSAPLTVIDMIAIVERPDAATELRLPYAGLSKLIGPNA